MSTLSFHFEEKQSCIFYKILNLGYINGILNFSNYFSLGTILKSSSSAFTAISRRALQKPLSYRKQAFLFSQILLIVLSALQAFQSMCLISFLCDENMMDFFSLIGWWRLN